MKLDEMKKLDVGDKIRWVDPDNDECSGDHWIVEIQTPNGRIADTLTVLTVANDRGSHNEIYASEIG